MDPIALLNLPAPEFVLPDQEGVPFQLADLRGRLVVLVFWSAECPHATRLDPHLETLARQAGQELAVLRIDSTPPAGQEEPHPSGLLWAGVILLDAQQSVADLFGALVTPHIVVIDRSGIVRYSGAPDDVTFQQRTPTRSYLDEALEAVQSGRLPDPQAVPAFGCAITRRPR
jgi:peroxiredoxin